MQRLMLAVGSIVLLTMAAYAHPFPTNRVAHPALTLVGDDGGDEGNVDAADTGDEGNLDAADTSDGTADPVTEDPNAADSSDGTGTPDAAAGAAGGTPQPTPPKNLLEGVGDMNSHSSTNANALNTKF